MSILSISMCATNELNIVANGAAMNGMDQDVHHKHRISKQMKWRWMDQNVKRMRWISWRMAQQWMDHNVRATLWLQWIYWWDWIHWWHCRAWIAEWHHLLMQIVWECQRMVCFIYLYFPLLFQQMYTNIILLGAWHRFRQFWTYTELPRSRSLDWSGCIGIDGIGWKDIDGEH